MGHPIHAGQSSTNRKALRHLRAAFREMFGAIPTRFRVATRNTCIRCTSVGKELEYDGMEKIPFNDAARPEAFSQGPQKPIRHENKSVFIRVIRG